MLRPIELYLIDRSDNHGSTTYIPAHALLSINNNDYSPLLVREVSKGFSKRYQLLKGDVFWRAAAHLQILEVRCEVINDCNDKVAAEIVAADLAAYSPASMNTTPPEEGLQIQQLLASRNISKSAFAKRTAVRRELVSNKVRVGHLPESIRKHIRVGRSAMSAPGISLGHARVLCSPMLTDAKRLQLAHQILLEKRSVRWLEAEVRKLKSPHEAAAESTRASTARPSHTAAGKQDPNTTKLLAELSAALSCAVEINEGCLIINYYGDNEILQGVVERLMPGDSF